MGYVIHDGDRYLLNCSGKSAGGKAHAYHWKNRNSAEQQLKIVKRWTGIYAGNWEVEEVQDAHNTTVSFEGNKLSNMKDMFSDGSILDNITSLTASIQERRNQLAAMYVQANGYCQDIVHAIELYDHLSAVQGWKLYNMLKEARRLRRKIKNEIAALDVLLNNYFNIDVEARVNQKMDDLMNQEYKTRIDTELFGGRKAGHFNVD